MDPTHQTYAELRLAYDHFNKTLYDGQLPHCLITLQRERRTYGYFSSKRFGNLAGQTTDEIAMNPEYFAIVPLLEVLQTIAHEMCHVWQAHFGTPGRGRYHNHEWADKLESIGLMPSSTGQPGGKRVGDSMADYVIPGCRFAAAVEELLQGGFAISWYDRYTPAGPLHAVGANDSLGSCIPQAALAVPSLPAGVVVAPQRPQAAPANRSNREKYTCPDPVCRVSVWGKPGLRIACIEHDHELVIEGCGEACRVR